MGIGEIAAGVVRGIGGLGEGVGNIFSDPVIRLGVTGLSRAGKTVFITSLVANLMDRGRMPGLRAAADGTIRKEFALSIGENSVHGSDAPETAKEEIAFWFAGNEIVG